MNNKEFNDLENQFKPYEVEEIICPECKDKVVKHCTTCFGYGMIHIKKGL